jgi:hypothetical protein
VPPLPSPFSFQEPLDKRASFFDCLVMASAIFYDTGDLEQAEAMYRKSLTLFQQLGAMWQAKQIQELLGAIHAR